MTAWRIVWTGLVSAAALAAQTGVIAGRVVELGTREPIEGARVVLDQDLPGPDGLIATAITDSSGRFSFDRVPASRWKLTAAKPGFLSLPLGSPRSIGPGEYINLADGARRDGLLFELPRLRYITGVIRDEEGDPVDGARVEALSGLIQRGKETWRPSSSTLTGSDGRYRIGPLRPMAYRIRANAPNTVSRLRPEVDVLGAPEPEARLGPRWFPDTDEADRAETLRLTASADLVDIDLRLRSEPLVKVAVQPTVPPGVDAGQVQVGLYRGGNWGSGLGLGDHVIAVPAAAYTLVATVDAGGRHLRAEQSVDLRGATGAVTVPVQLEAGVTIEGTIRVEGPNAGTMSRLMVELVPPREGPSHRAARAPTRERNATGGFPFTLTDVHPGVWDIGVSPIPQGSYLKSMRLGDKDVLTEEMTIGRGAPPPLEIVISTQAGIVQGQVRDDPESGKRSRVIVIAPDPPLRHVLSFYRVFQTDAMGRFTVRNLNPGKYTVYAFDTPQSSNDPHLLDGLDGQGEAFEVKDGETVQVRPALVTR